MDCKILEHSDVYEECQGCMYDRIAELDADLDHQKRLVWAAKEQIKEQQLRIPTPGTLTRIEKAEARVEELEANHATPEIVYTQNDVNAMVTELTAALEARNAELEKVLSESKLNNVQYINLLAKTEARVAKLEKRLKKAEFLLAICLSDSRLVLKLDWAKIVRDVEEFLKDRMDLNE